MEKKEMARTYEKDAACKIISLCYLWNNLHIFTWKISHCFFHGHQYIHKAYIYDINTILVTSMKRKFKEAMLETYQQIYNYLLHKN